MKNSSFASARITIAIFCVIVLSFMDSGGSGRAQVMAPAPLTGHEDHHITLEDAATLTRNFRAAAPQGAVLGEVFGSDAVRTLLNAPGSIGIRIYYGRKSDGTPVLILAGVDENGADITAAGVMEIGIPCPPVCDMASPLSH